MKWLATNRYNAVDMFGIYIIGRAVTEYGAIAAILIIPAVGLSYAVEKAAGFPNN